MWRSCTTNLYARPSSLLHPDSLHPPVRYKTSGRYVRPDGTYVGTVLTPGRYLRRDGTYIGTVHKSGRYMIFVNCIATVITRITLISSRLLKVLQLKGIYYTVLHKNIENNKILTNKIISKSCPFLPKSMEYKKTSECTYSRDVD